MEFIDIRSPVLEPVKAKEPILKLNEKERDIIRAAASGEFSQEDIQRKRSASESQEIADRIDKAVWELIKLNPDAFGQETVFQMADKFYKKERNQQWQQ
jgi:hypothetical protein